MAQPTYSYLANPNADRLDILASQVYRILSGGNPTADSPYDKREIKLVCEQVLVEMQGEIDRLNAERLYKDAIDRHTYDKQQYLDDLDAIYKFGGTSDEHIVTLESWPVLYDAVQELHYSILPDSYVNAKRYQNLPGEEQIRSIEPMRFADRRARKYRVLAASERRLLAGLQGNYAAERMGDKIWYYPDNGKQMVDKTLLIRYVLRPLRDGLPEPGLLQEAQDDMIIPKAVALLMRKVPHDDKNDANPTL